MKLVRESIQQFRRGTDPKKTLGLGKTKLMRDSIEKWIGNSTIMLYNYYFGWGEEYYIYIEPTNIDDLMVSFDGYYDTPDGEIQMQGDFYIDNIEELDIEGEMIVLEQPENWD